MKPSLLPRYWYVVAESRELTQNAVLARQVLDEWLACYRGSDGKAVVAQDRCIHRCGKLSSGSAQDGTLTCRYHGWVYGDGGRVISIPSEGGAAAVAKRNLNAKTYAVVEHDGYVYACLAPDAQSPALPFTLPRPTGDRWRSFRLQNYFHNNLTNCIENYIDVPHTAYVHHGVFRKPAQQQIRTTVSRQAGHVRVTYHGETGNLGSFSFLLNPGGREIEHEDNFYAPNITSVHYRLPNGYSYYITSQSVPVSEMETRVFTDISYDFGIFTPFAKWIARRQAQKVIDQDIDILNEQGSVIKKYGQKFSVTRADIIHTLTEEIISTLADGAEISSLKDYSREVTFHV